MNRGEPVYVVVIRNPSAAALEQELGGYGRTYDKR